MKMDFAIVLGSVGELTPRHVGFKRRKLLEDSGQLITTLGIKRPIHQNIECPTYCHDGCL
jgi:hypothetical protein